MKIRTHLAVIIAGTLVPVIFFSIIALDLLLDGERNAALRGLHESARATALIAGSAFGPLAAIAFFAAAAGLFGRRLINSIDGAKKSAAMLGQGRVPDTRKTGIDEVDHLHQALSDASMLLVEERALRQSAQDEREALLQRVQLARKQETALTVRLASERDSLKTLFQQAPNFMAVLRGENHVFELANLAYIRLVGERELIGKPVREVIPEVEGQGYFELLDNVFSTGQPYYSRQSALLLQREPGGPLEKKFVDFIYQPLREPDGSVSGIFVDGYDVTERKHADEALLEKEARYRTLVDTISAVVWRTDPEGAMLSDNTSWAVFTGQSEEEYRHHARLAVHAEDRELTFTLWHQAIATLQPFKAAFRLRRHDGRYRDMIAQAAPVKGSDGKIYEWIGNCTDVTETKTAEAAMRVADRRKDEFLAMLAHELRNPLAPISMAAQILALAGDDRVRVQQTGQIIERQVAHMTSLLDDLLDVSRVTRGLVTLSLRPVDIAGVIADAVEQTHFLIGQRHQNLSIRLAPETGMVKGDCTRLVQVVANLLNNAAKYTPEGGDILLQVALTPTRVEFLVRDTGIGISHELLPFVFDLFTQGERTSGRSQGGLGIGLALVKSLVELHGGSIVAQSDGPGGGSEFRVHLPRLSESPDHEYHRMADSPHEVWGKCLRVMVVDDNDAAELLAVFLRAAGHIVCVAHDARSALAKLPYEMPQVFILDIGLPDLDGYELIKRLKSSPLGARAIYIALTGYGQAGDRNRSRAAGFDYHVIKPADGPQLAALLGKIGSTL